MGARRTVNLFIIIITPTLRIYGPTVLKLKEDITIPTPKPGLRCNKATGEDLLQGQIRQTPS